MCCVNSEIREALGLSYGTVQRVIEAQPEAEALYGKCTLSLIAAAKYHKEPELADLGGEDMNKRFIAVLIFALSLAQGQTTGTNMGRLMVTVGESIRLHSAVNIQRVSVANGELVQAIAVTPREVLIKGKGPGETSLVVWQQNGMVWQQNGNRLLYDLTIRPRTPEK
jgi:Flp pilus assembly secretin CpaC